MKMNARHACNEGVDLAGLFNAKKPNTWSKTYAACISPIDMAHSGALSQMSEDTTGTVESMEKYAFLHNAKSAPPKLPASGASTHFTHVNTGCQTSVSGS